MIEAGILLGLSREISTQLVVQTMLGTAKQLRDEKMHPVELREMVTSPGGTTIAAIRGSRSPASARRSSMPSRRRWCAPASSPPAIRRARECISPLRRREERRVERYADPRHSASACRASTVSATGMSSRNSVRPSKSRTSSSIAATYARSLRAARAVIEAVTGAGIGSVPASVAARLAACSSSPTTRFASAAA